MTIFNGISEQCDREIRDTLDIKGGFTVIRKDMVIKALSESAATEPISAARAIEIDPNINRPYQAACRALEGDPELESVMHGVLGLLAARLLLGGRLTFEVRAFPKNTMTRAIAEQLDRDIGKNGCYCGLFVKNDDGGACLLGLLYPNGVLAPAAGITQETVEMLSLPFLTWDGMEARWQDPMPDLTPDLQRRLRFMAERLYPPRRYGGIAGWLAGCGVSLDDSERARLQGLCDMTWASADVAAFLGAGLCGALAIPGDGLPEAIFMPRLAIRQCREEALPGHMGGRLALKGMPVHLLPPVTEELLQADCAVTDAWYSPAGADGVEVTLAIHCGGEDLLRRKVYTADQIIDISAAPSVIQQYHMANVTDDMWTGRSLIVTSFGGVSRNNLLSIGYPLAAFPEVDQCVRPNGGVVKSYLISSKNAEWALYKTGVETRYAVLLDARGETVCCLLTAPAHASWDCQSRRGTGCISLDGGTTTSHVEVVVDDLLAPEPQLLEVYAEDLCQPVGPVDDQTFYEICSTIGTPDLTGALHPTAVQCFRTDGAPGELDMPGGSRRLLSFTSEVLAQLADDAGQEYLFNMKALQGSNRKESEEAYTVALATMIQIGYLYLASRGQQKIEVLLAYPGSAKQPRVLQRAVDMVCDYIPDRGLKFTAYRESTAAGAYVAYTRPKGLPISDRTGLTVIDMGGSTTDIHVSRGSESLLSESWAYASNLSQLSAGLALMRAPHEDMQKRWIETGVKAILKDTFGDPALDPAYAALADRLDDRLCRAMASSCAGQLDLVLDEKNRKLLEQIYRTKDWRLRDPFTLHWHQLWALPIADLVGMAVSKLRGEAAVAGFVGNGSIFLRGLLEADPAFAARFEGKIRQKSGARAFTSAFVGDVNKPEISRGMIYASRKGVKEGADSEADIMGELLDQLETMLPDGAEDAFRNRLSALRASSRATLEDARKLAGDIMGSKITREVYDAFVEQVTGEKLICDEENEDAFGLTSVYELLQYTPDTMDGFDDFEGLVQETLQNFPLACGSCDEQSTCVLLWLVAFNVANRNLLRRQLGRC